MSETTTNQPTFTRRTKKMSVKKEIGDLVAVTAKEASNTAKHALGTLSNLAEALRLETDSLVISARLDKMVDELDLQVESIYALKEYGMSDEDIETKVKVLRDAHVTKVLAQTEEK